MRIVRVRRRGMGGGGEHVANAALQVVYTSSSSTAPPPSSGVVGTVFAYGQTGSGKTYTMTGERTDPEMRGLIPNSFDHIFSHIAQTKDEQYLVRVSYLEIYKVSEYTHLSTCAV